MKQVAKRGFFHRKGRVGMKKRRSKTGSVLLFLLIFLLAAFMAFPLYYTVIQSLKPIEEIFRFPPTLYVSRPVMDNYGEMFRILANMWVPLSRYLFNTLFIAVLGTGLHVLVAGMAAYPLAKHNFPGRNLIFGVIMLGLLFVNQVTFVPSFVIIAKLDILNTYLAYLLPTIGVSLGLFLMRQFISQLPDSMLEAAKIDGANEHRVFFSIVFPSIKPAVITVIIFHDIQSTFLIESNRTRFPKNRFHESPLFLFRFCGRNITADICTHNRRLRILELRFIVQFLRSFPLTDIYFHQTGTGTSLYIGSNNIPQRTRHFGVHPVDCHADIIQVRSKMRAVQGQACRLSA